MRQRCAGEIETGRSEHGWEFARSGFRHTTVVSVTEATETLTAGDAILVVWAAHWEDSSYTEGLT